MLASRVLPPIVRSSNPPPPAPVATFFNVPRRYVKSNMQVVDSPSQSPVDDTKPSRSLRKSSRIHDTRTAPTSSPIERTKREVPPSPAVTSPRSASKKRLASLEEDVNSEDVDDNASLTDDQPPPSATSTGSPDFQGHVCLCLPEPKIPRPRNGQSIFSLFCDSVLTQLGGVTWNEIYRTKKLSLCSRMY